MFRSRRSCKIIVTTYSYKLLLEKFKRIYNCVVNSNYPTRQIIISFDNVVNIIYEQLDLFTDIEDIEKEKSTGSTC